jgi:hypothetical protein
VQQIGRRRLAARARDPGDRQVRGRVPAELGRERRERRAGVVDDGERHRDVELPLGDDRDRAVRDRLLDPVVAVDAGAADADEQRARPDAPGVDREVGDVQPVEERRGLQG